MLRPAASRGVAAVAGARLPLRTMATFATASSPGSPSSLQRLSGAAVAPAAAISPRPPTQSRSLSSSRPRLQEEQQPQEPTSGESEIISLLTKRFQPSHLQVQDVSGGCGSFYAIVVSAKDFQGLSTVKQHRLVNECLKDIIGNIHGLQLKTIPSD
ncbi:unnamed protein product [Parajaminaea phylloscopi]